MKSFEFIGIGGSTNIDLGGNCCYLREGDPLIKRLYCEVRSKISNEHIYYGDVLDLDKKKLVLMHFNTVDLYRKAIEDGFMVAKLAQALV